MSRIFPKTAGAAMIAALACAGGLTAGTTPAQASEHCKGVHITVDNPAGSTIKVIDIDYWDESAQRWRSKAIRDRTLKAGESWTWTKRLEGVAAENTALRIKYRVYIGKTFNKWSDTQRVVQGTRKCHRNMAWHFAI